MRGRVLMAAGLVVLALAAAAWWLLDRQAAGDGAGGGLAVPGLAGRVEAIDRIEVFGAGGARLVLLEKRDGLWRMPGRLDWPGNQREIGNALFRLGRAKRVEAKTADPARHARLGVEDVALETAKGTELRLSGGGEALRLVIGSNHPSLGGSHVRLGDDPQAWLIDEDVASARDPVAWLDRRLLDLPMARVERIVVTPAKGPAFVLARIDDRFTPDGVRPSQMANGDDGNATAGFTDQLALDDVAADDGAPATQTVVFEGVDGVRIRVAAWPGDGGTWARLSATLDEAKAREWLERADAAPGDGATSPAATAGTAADDGDAGTSTAADDGDAGTSPPADEAAVAGGDIDARLAALRGRVGQWQARFADRRFLLPPYKAEHLMKSRADYLDGTR